jgi:hypothetical protein
MSGSSILGMWHSVNTGKHNVSEVGNAYFARTFLDILSGLEIVVM